MNSIFWFVTIGSWILGFVVLRFFGSNAFFVELSRAVRVNNPLNLNAWWELIAYFTLTTVSVFALSHLFFGVAGPIFLFARGMYDGLLIASLENIIGGWTLVKMPISEVLTALIIVLILAINLPLCILAGHMGMQRSFYILNRLRGKPVNPRFGGESFSKLIYIVIGALASGLIAAVIFSYI